MSDYKQKYEHLLSDIYEVYKWIEDCREGGISIENSDYRKGYLNRIDNTLHQMNDWIPQLKSGEAEKVFHKLVKRCDCSAATFGKYTFIRNVCDQHLAEFIRLKNMNHNKLELVNLDRPKQFNSTPEPT